MDYGVQPYLFKSIEELENDELKRKIILNDDHMCLYIFANNLQMSNYKLY